MNRPERHFTPAKGWMNDPNGLIQANGDHHLFYQFNPNNAFGPLLNKMCWGHAKSADLAHWERLPVALEPDRPYDAGGVWSGAAVRDGGRIAVFYTGVSGGFLRKQSQCLAWSEDPELIRWSKHEGNPVVPKPPPGVPAQCFRDPYVWRHEGEWLMAVGASLRGRGAVLLYRSPDLFRWTYVHPLLTGGAFKGSWMWECPNFFSMDDRWVLLISEMSGKVRHFIGRFQDLKFHPESDGLFDGGSCLYAPQVFADDAGRRIAFGWLREENRTAFLSGRQGALSLPRALSLERGRLAVRPAPEVDFLRGGRIFHAADAILSEKSPLRLKADRPPFEIAMRVETDGATDLTVTIRDTRKSFPEVKVMTLGREGRLIVDRSRSSGDFFARKSPASVPIALAEDGALDLRVFLDGSILEAFINGTSALATRIYPDFNREIELSFSSKGGRTILKRLEVWE